MLAIFPIENLIQNCSHIYSFAFASIWYEVRAQLSLLQNNSRLNFTFLLSVSTSRNKHWIPLPLPRRLFSNAQSVRQRLRSPTLTNVCEGRQTNALFPMTSYETGEEMNTLQVSRIHSLQYIYYFGWTLGIYLKI